MNISTIHCWDCGGLIKEDEKDCPKCRIKHRKQIAAARVDFEEKNLEGTLDLGMGDGQKFWFSKEGAFQIDTGGKILPQGKAQHLAQWIIECLLAQKARN